MKIGSRRERIWGMFVLVILLGALQLVVHFHPMSGLSSVNSHLRSELSLPLFKESKRHIVRRKSFHRPGAAVTWRLGDTTNLHTVNNSGRKGAMYQRAPSHKLHVSENAPAKLQPPLLLSPDLFIPPQYDPVIFGTRRSKPGFLTIGIPSIHRPNAEVIYLFDTIQSIINTTSPDQRTDITVVIMLSDDNMTYNEHVADVVYERFRAHCDDGIIQVIIPPSEMYPDLHKLKRTKHDTVDRVKWRAKQNIDFAYLFLYSMNISRYYIQLEDDVLCADNFTAYIKQQIDALTSDWVMLEFSRLGFIGKLFKSNDLRQIAQVLLSNFDTQPGDLLLGKVLDLRGQSKPIYAEYSLFQHTGKFSSLLNKMMPSIDKYFKDFDNKEPLIRRLPDGVYPSATITTSFDVVLGYPASNAYDGNSTSFCWVRNPQLNEHFSVIFEHPQNFSRIVISTGDPYQTTDSLMTAYLYVGTRNPEAKSRTPSCDHLVKTTMFIGGEFDTKAMGIPLPRDITCLRIQPFKNNKTWVMIRELVLIP